jgi:hypothetical protein
MAASIESEPIWAKEYSNSTDIVWYFPDIETRLTADTRHLLETYSNIPTVEIIPHIKAIVSNLSNSKCIPRSPQYTIA